MGRPSYKSFNDRPLASKLLDNFNDRVAAACNKSVGVALDATNDGVDDAKGTCSPNTSTIGTEAQLL